MKMKILVDFQICMSVLLRTPLEGCFCFFSNPNYLNHEDYTTKCNFIVLSQNNRRSHQSCSMRKGALRNFTKLTGKRLCQGLSFLLLLKKRLWYRCFPVNFAKFLRTLFLQNPSACGIMKYY